MNKRTQSKNWLRPGGACLTITAVLLIAGSCRREIINRNNDKDLSGFSQTVLVANSSIYTPGLVDTNLHNAWGLAWAPSGIAWVNSMAGHVSDLFTGDGAIVRAGINIPSPNDTIGGLPTGIVFAGGAGFTLSNNVAPNFLFAGVDGVISGWNGAAGNNAIRIGSDITGKSSYTGLALTTWQGSHLLYAANFGEDRIDVWDTLFHKKNITFRDALIPAGFSPFNIQAIGSWLFVTYAKVGPDGRDQAGAGLGFVDVFQPDGVLVTRFAARGTLNAPWGVVETPANFLRDNDMTTVTDNGGGGNDGKGSPGGPGNGNGGNGDNRGNGNGDNSGPGNNNGNGNNNNNNDRDDDGPFILVGNFGDGHINVFGLDGSFRGQLQSHDRAMVINGLWALSFAPSTSTIDQNRLYFTAGPNKEADGVFGYLLKQ